MKNITMEDIAKSVGVSKVTVSKALSGKNDISKITKELIIKTAQEMGYTYKKNIHEQKNNAIVVLVTEKNFGAENNLYTQGFYTELYKLLTNQLELNNYMAVLNIISTQKETNNVIPRIIIEEKIDGIIVLGKFKSAFLKEVVKYNIPTIFLDFYSDEVYGDSVNTDNFFATHEITNYLIKNGHKAIYFVGNKHATTSIQDRFLGFHKSFISNRLIFSNNLIINDCDDEFNFIDIELPRVMPTAFVCSSDQAASRLIQHLVNKGYKVPEDVSVVGFDNTYHALEYDLTTMQVDLDKMAKTSVKIITNKIKQPDRTYGRVLINASIIVRNSVKNLV
jgi:LacI family transcriptional regulator